MRRRTSISGRALVAAAIATATLAATIASADAASCSALQAEYSALSKRSGGGGDARRQLDAARAEARRAGCTGGFLFFGKRNKPQCRSILARVDRLQRQVFSGGGFNSFSADRERQRVRWAMQRQGCNAPRSRGGEVDVVWGGAGSNRTLCVRSCDGYYFPISNSTPRSRLKIDEAVCQSLYPPGQAELFIHRTGGNTESMVSLKGEAYAAKPYALAYRSNYKPSCAALLRPPSSLIASLPSADEISKKMTKSKTAPVVAVAFKSTTFTPKIDPPVPTARPDPVIVTKPQPALGIVSTVDPTTLVALAGDDERGPDPAPSIRKLGAAYYYEKPQVIEALKFARMKPSKHRGPTPMTASMLPSPAEIFGDNLLGK